MGERTMVERAAVALREEADKFSDPVAFYVQHEALRRWQNANPDKRWQYDGSVDWEAESWKILVRAVMRAMREPTDAMVNEIKRIRGTSTMDGWERESIVADWRSMLDAALKEGT